MIYNFTKRDLYELEKSYPEAYRFLSRRSLFNEYRHLSTNSLILNDLQKKRLNELESICGFNFAQVASANAKDFLFDCSID